MDKQRLGIVALITSAVVLLGLNLTTPQASQAASAVSSRQYQAVTTKAQGGGEAVYVLDNQTGQIAVLMYDKADRTVRARDVRPVRELFFGR